LIESYPEEAEKARTVAPAFTRDALKTISRLEEQILFEEALRSLRLKAVSSPKM
jgi:hypothetical protein